MAPTSKALPTTIEIGLAIAENVDAFLIETMESIEIILPLIFISESFTIVNFPAILFPSKVLTFIRRFSLRKVVSFDVLFIRLIPLF